MDKPLFDLRNVYKKYGATLAINDLSFTIGQGEFLGLLGPNGAGKSTLISLLTGLLQPTSGVIHIAGRALPAQGPALKRRIGLAPQELAFYPALSAVDNLHFFGRIYGLHGCLLATRTAEVLALVGLDAQQKQRVQHFSGGMQRRLNLAIALLHKPDILFLDEPTVGVDPQSRLLLFDALQRLHSQGVTILYSTHYMEEAQRLCQRVAILDRGRLLALDTPAALQQSLGEGVIQVSLANSPPPHIAQQISTSAAVKAATQQADRLTIAAHHTQEALCDLLALTSASQTRITALQILEPNLETVFLRLTGKQLRE